MAQARNSTKSAKTSDCKASASQPSASAKTAAAQSQQCANGVCCITWKPQRPNAAA